ncbi:MAG: FGGY-family carbohydrate kinase [Microbacterium sp.]|uniref:FGGY-family carbohydrate kinase n=1 Tax=Microbacterium sp. TaxID=51671 RepID=UPI003F819A4F
MVGGGAGSAVWMQMLADVLGRTVIVPGAPRYAGVLGAYAAAATALRDPGAPAALRVSPARPVTTFTPDPAATEVYDRLFAISQRRYSALAQIFADLNAPTTTQEGTKPRS